MAPIIEAIIKNGWIHRADGHLITVAIVGILALAIYVATRKDH